MAEMIRKEIGSMQKKDPFSDPFIIVENKFPNAAYFFTINPEIFTEEILRYVTQSKWSVAHQLVRDGYVPLMSETPDQNTVKYNKSISDSRENLRTKNGFDCDLMSMRDERGVSVLEVGLLSHPEIWLDRVAKNKKSWRCIDKVFLPKILERVLKYVFLYMNETNKKNLISFAVSIGFHGMMDLKTIRSILLSVPGLTTKKAEEINAYVTRGFLSGNIKKRNYELRKNIERQEKQNRNDYREID